MSILEKINTIKANVSNTYEALEEMGATIPSEQDSSNLADTVRTIQRGTTLPNGAIAIQIAKNNEASAQVGSGYSLSITYGSDVKINDSIALGFVGTTKTLSNISETTDFSVLQGKYIRMGSSYGTTTGAFYYIPTGSTFTVSGSSMSKALTCDKAQKVSIQKVNL